MDRYKIKVSILMKMSSGTNMPTEITLDGLSVVELNALISIRAKNYKLHKLEIN